MRIRHWIIWLFFHMIKSHLIEWSFIVSSQCPLKRLDLLAKNFLGRSRYMPYRTAQWKTENFPIVLPFSFKNLVFQTWLFKRDCLDIRTGRIYLYKDSVNRLGHLEYSFNYDQNIQSDNHLSVKDSQKLYWYWFSYVSSELKTY